MLMEEETELLFNYFFEHDFKQTWAVLFIRKMLKILFWAYILKYSHLNTRHII